MKLYIKKNQESGDLLLDNYGFTITDLTVKDNQSGLVWTRDGDLAEKGIDWDDACKFIARLNQEGYAGYSDWRLPTAEELIGLFERGKIIQESLKKNTIADAFNQVVFFNVWSDYYWSSTTDANNTDRAWIVEMLDGTMTSGGKPHYHSFWPVRAG